MTTKRKKRQPYPRTVAFVPERKPSESILDFAAPLLQALGPLPEPDEARRALELAINIWNFHVMASPLWGKPKHLADARKAMCGKQAPPGLADSFELLSSRRRNEFSLDPRFVGKWSFEATEPGRHDLVCEAMLPEGVEAYVPPPAEKRIAIGGKFLDEVRIRQTATSFLCFPVENHRGEVGSDGVATIHAKVLTVVELFAQALLTPVGGGPVDVVVAGKQLGPMLLGEVRCAGYGGHHDVVALVFRPANAQTTA